MRKKKIRSLILSLSYFELLCRGVKMTLTFGTISDIDRSRQRIIDCKLKSRWPRGFCIDGSPFVFAAVKRIHAYLEEGLRAPY